MYATIDVGDPCNQHLLPKQITSEWLVVDLGLSDRTILKYRQALIKYCPAYQISATCRYPGGYAAYQAKAIQSFPKKLYLDEPPYTREEALILRAFAYLVLTKGRSRGRLQRAIFHLQQDPDFWRKFDLDDYYYYKAQMRKWKNESKNSNRKMQNNRERYFLRSAAIADSDLDQS